MSRTSPQTATHEAAGLSLGAWLVLAVLPLLMLAGAEGACAQSLDLWGVLPEPGAAAATLPGDSAPMPCDLAEPAAGQALALTDAIRRALCNNPRTRQAWHEAAAQAAAVGTARASYLPTLSANLNVSHDTISTRTSYISKPQRNRVQGASYSVNWLLLDAGARAANVQQAQQQLAAALAARDGVLQQVFVAAAQAYHEAVAAAAALQAAQQAEATARETAQAAEAKSQAGSATVVELLQARTAASQATLARVRAQGLARSSLGALAHAMGTDLRQAPSLAPDAALDPDAEPLATPDFMGRIDELVASARDAHPALVAARAQIAAAEARLIATHAEGYPTLSASYSNFVNGRPGTALPTQHTHERLAAVTLSIPIFEGLSRNYRLHEQRAQLEARRADLAGQESQVAYEVWRAYEALQTEAAGLNASADLMRSATEALRAARARYRAGAADTIDVLNAQKDEAQARQERITALASWRMARLRLLAGLGRLGFWALDA